MCWNSVPWGASGRSNCLRLPANGQEDCTRDCAAAPHWDCYIVGPALSQSDYNEQLHISSPETLERTSQERNLNHWSAWPVRLRSNLATTAVEGLVLKSQKAFKERNTNDQWADCWNKKELLVLYAYYFIRIILILYPQYLFYTHNIYMGESD